MHNYKAEHTEYKNDPELTEKIDATTSVIGMMDSLAGAQKCLLWGDFKEAMDHIRQLTETYNYYHLSPAREKELETMEKLWQQCYSPSKAYEPEEHEEELLVNN